jgi:4-carboxymuconolactone decarboxylase
MARVRLLAAQDVPAEHRAFVEAMDARGSLINIYRAMAHSPVVLRRFSELLLCLWAGALGDRVRETAILSVVSASDSPYPLSWHILDGADAGLTEAEIRAIIGGNAAAVLAPAEAAVAEFARALALDARVSDATFQAVAGAMSEQQIVELTMLAGLYRMVACFANGLSVELDAEAERALTELREEMA